MRNGRALADVLVDFALESHDGLGWTVERAIYGDTVVLLKCSNVSRRKLAVFCSLVAQPFMHVGYSG